jgi:hypothetical protein
MSELDRAVEEALRTMVAGEGPEDMRARVMARVDAPVRARRVPWPALAAAASIAVAAAGVAQLRRAPSAEHAPAAPKLQPPTRAVSSAPPAETPVARTPTSTAAAAAAGGRLHIRPTARARFEAVGRLPDLETVMEVVPIQLAPLLPVVPISEPPIVVAALAIEPVEIEPLAAPQP